MRITSPFHVRLRQHVGHILEVGAVAIAVAAGFAGGRSTVMASSPPSTTQAAVQGSVVSHAPAILDGRASYADIVERIAPAVVTVRVEKTTSARPIDVPLPFREFFGQGMGEGRKHREGGIGSGVIIAGDGYVLTNHHVIGGADSVKVDLADGRSFAAKVIGSDPASDLAVLRVDATGLPTVAFGDSDRVRVGDVVLAFGNPLGVGQTVTMGIVSAKGRTTGVSDGNYEDFLQTDAPINQGNSGGALVNLRGELVGINAQILSPSGGNIGLGFAIPASMARAVSDQLREGGVVHRAKLGVTVQPVTPEIAQSLELPTTRGALVSDVEPDSPAARAGLSPGDVITTLDGQPVNDANTLRNRVAAVRPGSEVSLGIVRKGRTESISARVIEREVTSAKANAPTNDDPSDESSLGLAVSPLTPDVADDLHAPHGTKGVVVTDIDPDGAGAAAGFQRGDIIVRVDAQPITSVASLRSSIATRTGKPRLVLLQRQGAQVFIAIPAANS